MNYKSLANKWRPFNFKDIVGHKIVIDLLKNSIKYNLIVHAYILSGPSGVGKTTLARIFAKAINCEKHCDDGEPCGNCISCKNIENNISADLIEIDGASNNKDVLNIDQDMFDLCESIKKDFSFKFIDTIYNFFLNEVDLDLIQTEGMFEVYLLKIMDNKIN